MYLLGVDILGPVYQDALSGTDSAAITKLEDTIKPIGISGYRIAYIAMVFIFVVGFLVGFVKLFLFSDGRTRAENKSDIIWKIVTVVCAFGAIGLIVLITSVGASLF